MEQKWVAQLIQYDSRSRNNANMHLCTGNQRSWWPWHNCSCQLKLWMTFNAEFGKNKSSQNELEWSRMCFLNQIRPSNDRIEPLFTSGRSPKTSSMKPAQTLARMEFRLKPLTSGLHPQEPQATFCAPQQWNHKMLTKISKHERLWRPLGKLTPTRFSRKKGSPHVTSPLPLSKSPSVRLSRPLGKLTPFRVRLNLLPNDRLWRPLGKPTPSRVWLNSKPNARFLRPLGKFTPFRVRLNLLPNDRLWRPLGKLTPSRVWLNSKPNARFLRPLGKFTPSRVRLNLLPNVRLWRPLGKLTPSRVWLNSKPNVRVWRPLGKFTPSRVRLNLLPNVRLWRPLGKLTPSRVWLKLWQKWSVSRVLGRCCKYTLLAAHRIFVTPSSALSPLRDW